MNVVLFGGTTEGRLLAMALAERGHTVTVSVATAEGAEELRHMAGIQIWSGHLSRDDMAIRLPGFDLCVDATHPYAVEATENIRAACTRAAVPCRRILRARSNPEAADAAELCFPVVRVHSAAEAAAYLASTEGRVLLTVGSRTLPAFAPLGTERLYVRILPTHASLSACEALGIPHRQILALYGPFSEALNAALLDQYGISYLVTKDSGQEGGYPEKMAAARSRGVTVILWERPKEEGLTMEAFLAELDSGGRRGLIAEQEEML